MKKKILISAILYSFFASHYLYAQSPDIIEDELFGMFDGRTPCQELAEMLNVPVTAECIKIKWRLRLYENGSDTSSGRYQLEGFRFRGEQKLIGDWQLEKGTKADSNAMVCQLNHRVRGEGFLNFQMEDNNVLFFLDKGKNILVGNRNFSYALYRIDDY